MPSFTGTYRHETRGDVEVEFSQRDGVSDLTKHPLKDVIAYDGRNIIDERRAQGVYRKFRDPKGGISSEQNLDRWADYAKSNSYTGHGDKAGHGKDPTMPDPRGSHSQRSDGYLAPLPSASTETWADHRAGSESGEGRLEKLHSRK
jgi:hypothetical protein